MPGTELAKKPERRPLGEVISGLAPEQLLVMVMVAEREKPKAIIAAVTERFGAEHKAKDSWIYSVSSWLDRPEKYKPLIDDLRRQLAEVDAEPILDVAWRLKQRREMVLEARADKQFTEARHSLNDVDRMQGIDPGPKQPSGASMNLQVNTFNSGDMNRPPANAAERAEWRRQIEHEFGLPPRLPLEQENDGEA